MSHSLSVSRRGLWLLAAYLFVAWSTASADDWPQWLGPTRDAVWTETGILETFPPDGPKIVWRAAIAGGYAGPAVAEGRVYVTDFVTDGKKTNNPGSRDELDGTERVLCFDAASGKLLWKHEYACHYGISYPAGPRATPTVFNGKVYALGAEGRLTCLDAVSGKPLWTVDFKERYGAETPIWGFAGHPLCDGERLYCLAGGKGSVAVALDPHTGEDIWKALSAREIGYSSPTMIEAGGTRQLIIWHAESINGLDPRTGKVYWTVPLEPQYGMSIMAPRREGNLLYAGGIGNQSVLLELAADKPAATEVWRGTARTSIYSVCSPPIIHDGLMFGACQQGQFRGVRLKTGERLWETFAPTTGKDRAGSAAAFVVRHGDRYFLMSETGDLIIARLSAKGYEEISRAHILAPTNEAFGRDVVWSHPAFARRCMFARNDAELVCVSLAQP